MRKIVFAVLIVLVACACAVASGSIPELTSSFTIAPKTAQNLQTPARALYVGTGGNVKMQMVVDTAPVTLTAVPSGTMLQGFRAVYKIYSTGTTASNIVGFY